MELLRHVHNVDIVVERRPTAMDRKVAGVHRGQLLLGLYHGIPITQRGEYYNLVAPDKISIYQESIEATCSSYDAVREEVRRTVLHELGHYFGIDDERLHELGMG